MSALSVTGRPQRGTLGDLAAMWVALFAALAYLDVPLRNAPLFAIALVLQAALGTLVITRLLDGLQPSLLLLCGPGLILGGALSFAVFQIVGRGAVGLVATALVGIVAAGILGLRGLRVKEPPRLWLLGQLLGLSATAMMREFDELLPIAILLFLIGFVLSPHRSIPRWAPPTSIAAFVITAGLTVAARQDYWWVVTDDYQYFEVISQHITQSGPTADWGVLNFFKYHWLSYGWAGLLDFMGGHPSTFVTLTRVMPLVYSLALAASLILICRLARRGSLLMSGLVPVWAVITIADLDWSGTSTAGVYAVLAATAFTLLHLSIQQEFKSLGLLLFGVFISILLLTKVTSGFAILAFGLAVATSRIAERFQRRGARLTVLLVGLIATVCITTSLVWLLGPDLGWRFDLLRLNNGLGQLSEASKMFGVGALVLLKLPVWTLVVFSALEARKYTNNTIEKVHLGLSVSFPLLILGLLLELSILSVSNIYAYIAGPMYFVASLSVIYLFGSGSTEAFLEPSNRLSSTVMAFLVLVGLTWTGRLGAQQLWTLVDQKLLMLSDLHVALLRYATSNSRVGASLGAAALGVVLLRSGRILRISRVLPLPLVILAFTNTRLSSLESFRTEVSQDEISAGLGNNEIRTIAEELRRNSDPTDVVATNHLYGALGNPLSDFSIAAWSRREFLILGPRFVAPEGFRVSNEQESEALRLSLEFAHLPSPESCMRLWNAGVKFYVVDLQLVRMRDFSVCSDVVAANGNYVLLSLREVTLR